jgi:hypothetical protein
MGNNFHKSPESLIKKDGKRFHFLWASTWGFVGKPTVSENHIHLPPLSEDMAYVLGMVTRFLD